MEGPAQPRRHRPLTDSRRRRCRSAQVELTSVSRSNIDMQRCWSSTSLALFRSCWACRSKCRRKRCTSCCNRNGARRPEAARGAADPSCGTGGSRRSGAGAWAAWWRRCVFWASRMRTCLCSSRVFMPIETIETSNANGKKTVKAMIMSGLPLFKIAAKAKAARKTKLLAQVSMNCARSYARQAARHTIACDIPRLRTRLEHEGELAL